MADPATFEALDTALDAVALPPAATLDAIIVAAETTEAAVLSPPAAALLAPAGQFAADGSVTWTLKSGSAIDIVCMDSMWLTCHTIEQRPEGSLYPCVNGSSIPLGPLGRALTRLIRWRACVLDAAGDARDPVTIGADALDIEIAIGRQAGSTWFLSSLLAKKAGDLSQHLPRNLASFGTELCQARRMQEA